jgi:hypothetical protein
MRSRLISLLVLFVVSILPLSYTAQAGEILAESGKNRVVSGDTTVWLTRGISATPSPASLSTETMATLLDSVSVELDAVSQAALVAGVRRFGWAQYETEPVGVSKHIKVRICAVAESLIVTNMDVHDRVVAKTIFDARTGTIQSSRYTLSTISSRTAHEGLISPEMWVMRQEHLQKQFFESIIDPDLPGLSAARNAYYNGKYSLGLYEVAEFYRRKAQSTGTLTRSTPPTSQTDAAAERVVDHIFGRGNTTVQMGERIDWQTIPEVARAPEWIWGFNSHNHFVTLLRGYQATANEKYAKEYADQICDFILRNPAPPYTITRVAAWRNLEAGMRGANSWPQSFYGFLSSPSFTPQAIQLVLTGMWSHGQYIYEHPAGLRRPSNWSIVDETGLCGISLYFPEFTESNTWRDSSYARLAYQLHLQVNNDGGQYELAPGYHRMCLGRFQAALKLTEKTGNKLPEEFGRRVESMYDYLMWLMKPDGSQPSLSDTRPSNLKGTLLQGAHRFDRDDLLYLGSGGEEGRRPDGTSHLLPDAGYAVMRSGWEPDARYLLLDGGPVGIGHQHEDKLAILLSAYGEHFLVDTGPFVYNVSKWRRHAMSTAAHSTALIDGQDQNRILTNIEHLAAETPTPHWESSDDRDYVVAEYNSGYGPDSIPVVHRRHVLFQKPDYWVVVDEFHGEGEHTVETLFTFAPELDVSIPNSSVVLAKSSKGPTLTIQPSGTSDIAVDIVTGQEEPRILGWYSPHDREPAPVAVYRTRTQLPLVQAYLLYPTRAAGDAVPTMTTTRSGDSLVVDVTSPGRVEHFSFSLSEDK